VIEYYFDIGGKYYVETEQTYKVAPTGKQDWARTARKQMPLVQCKNGVSSFIYTNFEVRSTTPNDAKLITQINKYCMKLLNDWDGFMFRINLRNRVYTQILRHQFK